MGAQFDAAAHQISGGMCVSIQRQVHQWHHKYVSMAVPRKKNCQSTQIGPEDQTPLNYRGLCPAICSGRSNSQEPNFHTPRFRLHADALSILRTISCQHPLARWLMR
jgi:hypothetical protein